MIKKLFYFLILFVLISCDTRLTTSEIEEDLGSSLIESISEYYDVSYSDFDLLSFDLVHDEGNKYYESFQYAVTTVGVNGKFGRFFELNFNVITNFALDYSFFALKAELCMVFHFSTGNLSKSKKD